MKHGLVESLETVKSGDRSTLVLNTVVGDCRTRAGYGAGSEEA
jgi:hypothetical protein